MRLQEIRKDRGLTLKQVAERSKLSEAAICLYENGKRKPMLDSLIRLANALDVTVDQLLDVHHEQ